MKHLKTFEDMFGDSMEDGTSNIINNKCPNCGASLHDDNCEYCGSFFGKRTKKSTINKKETVLNKYGVNNYHMLNE